ncbi:HYS2 [Candida oxycetoniae]|uniref:DNA-directed DNA polymerase n=1 Tax=Candida oxycetoniae TaxID=497107 RepID=A0AAI9SWL5_9ASCO|nr:HYS2 [Candida oxycetoniae]KAI3404132.1 HYS2 [Candida oxycetoniae]
MPHMSYKEYLTANSDDSKVFRKETEIPVEFDKRNEFFIDPKSRKYDKQYFSMYQYRLSHLKERVISNAMEKWGNCTREIDGQKIVKQDKILDIQSGKLCWVVGTVFCDAKYKLNILSDVEKGTDDILPLVPARYVSDEDQPIVMLEDESGRAVLHNEEFLKKNLLVTGCIVGVLGIEIQAGIFEIMDVVYPKCAPQKPLKTHGNGNVSGDVDVDVGAGRVAIVSGLNIGVAGNYDLKIELLKQYLIGELGADVDKSFSSEISQLVVAGNSIEPIRDITAEEDLKNFVTTNNYGSKNITKYTTESLKQLDQFISEVVVSLPVAIMPGDHDPAEISLPQQPLHKSIFNTNRAILGSDRLQRLTNPVWLEMNGVRILGTSGQNVDDVKKYITTEAGAESSLSMRVMKSSMKWQNFVPTAPDTLYCYPYDDYDPFIFTSELPHVYFVGNQDKYAIDTYTCEDSGAKVRLISVPDFKSSGEFVILNVGTLETEVVKIKV